MWPSICRICRLLNMYGFTLVGSCTRFLSYSNYWWTLCAHTSSGKCTSSGKHSEYISLIPYIAAAHIAERCSYNKYWFQTLNITFFLQKSNYTVTVIALAAYISKIFYDVVPFHTKSLQKLLHFYYKIFIFLNHLRSSGMSMKIPNFNSKCQIGTRILVRSSRFTRYVKYSFSYFRKKKFQIPI